MEGGLTPYLKLESNECQSYMLKFASNVIKKLCKGAAFQYKGLPVRSPACLSACSRHPIPQGFSIIIVKPYVKAVTHSEKLELWIILMVDCVTIVH